MKKIAVVMGSDSDLPVARAAAQILDELEIKYEMYVYSAHRTPDEAICFAKSAEENGFAAVIAIAGMAAHLAGVIAANTVLPVIGVPCASQNLGGLDALLSTVQMPSGIPVATVAIGGGKNAALLAAQIIAVENSVVSEKLKERRKNEHEAIMLKNKCLTDNFNK